MSKVSSITITTRRSVGASPPTSPVHAKDYGKGGSSSESDSDGKPRDRRTRDNVAKKDYDEERGLYRVGRSGRKSSVEKLLEEQLNTADPELTQPVFKDDNDYGDYGDIFLVKKGQVQNDTEESSNSDVEGKTIYAKKKLPAPKKVSEVGNRIQSRKGKLLDQYEKDIVFVQEEESKEIDLVRPSQPISLLKSSYNQREERKSKGREEADNELELIRQNMNRGTSIIDEPDDDRRQPNESIPEVKYRKSISSIKDRYFAAAKGKRVMSSSDSEEEEEPTKREQIEVVPSASGVGNVKQVFQQDQKEWRRPDTVIKENARESIDSSSVSEAMRFCKIMESKPMNYSIKSSVNKPKTAIVQDPRSLMAMRRNKTYGDEDQVDEGTRKAECSDITSIDIRQIKNARQGYEHLEAKKAEQPVRSYYRPSAKIIRDDDVMQKMEQHKQRTSSPDNNADDHVNQNGISNGYYDSKISVGRTSIHIATH